MFLFSPANIIFILMQARAEVCRSVGFNQNWNSLQGVTFSLSCWNDTACSVRFCRASQPAAWECIPGCGLWLGAAPTCGRGARRCTSVGRSRQSAGSALRAMCSAAASSLPYAAALRHLLMLSRLAFLISEHHLYQSRALL